MPTHPTGLQIENLIAGDKCAIVSVPSGHLVFSSESLTCRGEDADVFNNVLERLRNDNSGRYPCRVTGQL